MRKRKKREWEALFEELKEASEKIQVICRETSRIRSPGALCTVRGRKVMIINRTLDIEDKVSLMVAELKSLDFSEVFLKPHIRELLE